MVTLPNELWDKVKQYDDILAKLIENDIPEDVVLKFLNYYVKVRDSRSALREKLLSGSYGQHERFQYLYGLPHICHECHAMERDKFVHQASVYCCKACWVIRCEDCRLPESNFCEKCSGEECRICKRYIAWNQICKEDNTVCTRCEDKLEEIPS